MTSAGGVAYTWDDNGNLVGDGLNSYSYNQANRLISMMSMPPAVSFTYNGLGDRMQQTYAGNTTTYLLDIASYLTQVLGDGDSTYLYGLGRIGEEGAAGWQYHHGDALGSVRQLTGSGGTATLAKSYEPYGDELSSVGDVDTPYDFTGEWRDNTGLIYLRARYYEATVGRFISRDTWGGDLLIPMSYNMWTYAYANPLRYTDPSGRIVLVPVIIGGVIGGAIGGAIGGVGYVIANPGQSVGEYARSGAFWRAAGAGAVGGLVIGLMPFGGASFASAIGYGIIGGMAAGAAEQLTFNLLSPCTEWYENLLQATLVGGVSGGVFGGVGYGIRGLISTIPSNVTNPNELGRTGEIASGIVKNTKRIESLTGKANYRVPDQLLPEKSLISEVKNVSRLSYTNQIKDYILFAKEHGYTFELWIRKTTELSKPLQDVIERGLIILKFFK